MFADISLLAISDASAFLQVIISKRALILDLWLSSTVIARGMPNIDSSCHMAGKAIFSTIKLELVAECADSICANGSSA